MTSLVPTVPFPAGEAKALADRELWERIKAHPLDKPGVDMPFSKRLAEENGWPESFALEVIEEYRRFVYLACTAGEEVTPSDEVDQVWHLHLAYSRDYWDAFCANVLRRPLHHGPTEGGPAERSRYEANYLRTMKLYQYAFGKDGPPMHIWPPPQIRFDPKSRPARVDLGRFEITPRASRWKKFVNGAVGICAVLIGLSLLLTLYDSQNQILAVISSFFLVVVAVLNWFQLDAPKRPRKFRKRREETVRQPQHGYWLSFTATYGAVGGVETLLVSPPTVTRQEARGDGASGGGDVGGCGTSCGGGCGGCGG